jgi:hypothetical protein
MKKEALIFLLVLSAAAESSPLWAQPAPRFYLNRMIQVQGCQPKEDNSAVEARRESAFLQKTTRVRDNFPVHLSPSLLFSPRPGEKLWVFYDSACRGSVMVRGLKAQKTGGKITAIGWFEVDASALPVSIDGDPRWLERAVYLEARPSEKEPIGPAAGPTPEILPEYDSQQIFTRMLEGLKNPPPDWQIKRWMTESNYGQSFVLPESGIKWLELRYKYPTKETNQTVLCRMGDTLRVWNRLPHNKIDQAFEWEGKTYLVLTQTGRGITWMDLYRLDPKGLIWVSGHRLPEDPALDDRDPQFQFQKNSKGYIGD